MGHQQSSSKRVPLLEQKVLSLLEPTAKMFCVRDNDSIATMLSVCNEKKISSTPVYSVDYHTVLGIVDMTDIVAYIVSEYRLKGAKVLSHPEALLQAPVSAAMEKSPRNKFLLLPYDTNVFEAAKKMCDLLIYRVAIMDEYKKITGIVTQSTIMGFLQKHLADLYPGQSKAVSAIKGLGTTTIKCVHEEILAINAYEEMFSKSVSCIGVTSINKTLTCCLSASHLKGITIKELPLLLKPVKEFVSQRQIALIKSGEIQPQLLTGTEDMTMAMMISSLNAHRFHHFFVIDAETQLPKRIISLSDLLREVLYSGRQIEERNTLHRPL